MSPAKTSSQPMAMVALLRGINVAGKHQLPMKQLTEFFVEAKCAEVRTYIQSGNVIFKASAGLREELSQCISKKIEQRFGFTCPVILRTATQMAQTVRDNPFLRADMATQTLYVYFLADAPSASAVKTLDPARSAPDAFHLLDRQIYLHLPNGMARTKLTNAYFDAKLATVCTARNWTTVLTLLKMMQA
ncbi:MAG: DUF1697 domain-containing protein [Candidatus Korobacteraceae bacterium]